MTTLNWRSRLVQMARVIPPIARLHDERNALQEQVARLEQSRRADPHENGDREVRAQWERERELRRQGLVIELDYPCLPRMRSFDRMLGGNVYRRIIETGEARYGALLSSFLAYQTAFTRISVAESTDERAPHWSNPWFPALDAICLSGLVAKLNPRRYVEVGSGNSTKYVRRAISDHGLRTRVISIDPYPRAVIDDLCDEVIRDKLENCDLKVFADLGPEDLVFIDNSHRSFQGSDVTVFFTEILPLLKSGCHYGIHDIFLPHDYVESWLSRYYNEQYLLMAYLLGGASGDEIVLPVHHVEKTPALLAVLDPLLRHPALSGVHALGGAFWMKRR
jgi:predicted O-methyltransferase YrrM